MMAVEMEEISSTAEPTPRPPSDDSTLVSARTSQTSPPTDPPTVDLVEFAGDVDTDNTIPSPAVLQRIRDLSILDKEGKSLHFRSLYEGANVPRRVLVVFVRHFFCGNCQQFVATLSTSITPDDLLKLPIPTSLAIVGCGSPSLVPMYASTTGCVFPIYADPSHKLYEELGMNRTLALGSKPEYMRKGMVAGMLRSVAQVLKNVKSGNALQGGDQRQVGGEFLFEDASGDAESPVDTPGGIQEGAGDEGYFEKGNKRVTWYHRMRNTRDHVEIPELREVLGLGGTGEPGKDSKRWSKAVAERKGTRLSMVGGKILAEKGRTDSGISGHGR